MGESAQGNTVKVVQGMYELCRKMDSELWDTFYECYGTPTLEWIEVRRKLTKKDVTIGDMLEKLENMKYSGEPMHKSFEEFLKEEYGNQKSMW